MTRLLTLAWRVPRAAAGLAVTAVLLAGVPWGLARTTGSPRPGNWPGWRQVQGFFASPLTDDTIIRALADAAWLLWAVFALSLILEIIAAARGQPAPRLPAVAPVQALAAALVGATMMTALHAPRTGSRTAPPLHAALTSATTVSAPVVPGNPARPEAAAAHAGAPSRDEGKPGTRPRVYRVKEGDDLWDIAGRLLGNTEDWHQIYRLNEGRPQPDGRALTDPNLIIPGWVLLIPQPGHGQATRPNPAHPAIPGTRAPGPSRTAGPAPQPSRTAEPSSRPSEPSPGQAPATARSTPAPAAHPPRAAVRLPSGALIGISVAIMVAAALTLAAIQRRRRYRPRHGPPSSLQPDTPPLPDVIAALRRAAQPARPPDPAEPPGDDPYPDLYAAGPGPDGDGDADPGPAQPSPAPQPEPEAPVQEARPPGTVPLGIGRDDREAAVSIAALGGLGLTGPGAGPAARAILAALLAQSPPAETGLPAAVIPAADAARLLPGTSPAAIPGLSVPATLGAALDEMETLLLTLARANEAGSTAGDLTDDGPSPGEGGAGAALIASVPQDSARRLAGILEAGRRTGTAAVLLGAWPPGTTCEVAADGTVTAVTPPNQDLDGIRLFTLAAAEAAAIASVLQEADGTLPDTQPGADSGTAPSGRPAQSPEPAADGHPRAAPQPRPVPAPALAAPPGTPGEAGAARAGQQATPAGRPVQISLLGPLRITARGKEVTGGLRKARELLAYLAVHPDGATGEAVTEALWPESDPGRGAGQRNLAVRRARDMLRAATGLTTPMWILNASGSYRLDPALISTDLQAFSDALEAARQATGQARLAACREAVALYRGELAEGAGYEWAEPYAEAARRRALDAWTTIAEILQPADPDQALSALEAALGHDPYNEYLYQKIMRLQAAAGRPEAVRRTLRLLESRLTELSITPSARTRQVAASLLNTPGPGPARQPAQETAQDGAGEQRRGSR